MHATGIRLVARRHVDFQRVCSACCRPGIYR
ncbi:Ms4527A family Cys-rich leader peptide [Nocardia camponoti]